MKPSEIQEGRVYESKRGSRRMVTTMYGGTVGYIWVRRVSIRNGVTDNQESLTRWLPVDKFARWAVKEVAS